MEWKYIQEMIEQLKKNDLSVLEIEDEKGKLRIERKTEPALPFAPASPAAGQTEQPVKGNTTQVRSPLVGIVYAALKPGDPPCVSEGQKVKKGDLLCLVEAMKVMNEIKAPADGTVRAVLFQNEDLVQFDTPLFEMGE